MAEGWSTSGTFRLDLQSLPSGSYEIRIYSAEDLWRRRILKL